MGRKKKIIEQPVEQQIIEQPVIKKTEIVATLKLLGKEYTNIGETVKETLCGLHCPAFVKFGGTLTVTNKENGKSVTKPLNAFVVKRFFGTGKFEDDKEFEQFCELIAGGL